jgi:hypothetical protein
METTQISWKTRVIGWIAEQFVKYELNKLSTRNVVIGSLFCLASGLAIKTFLRRFNRKQLPCSGYVLITGGNQFFLFFFLYFKAASGLGYVAALHLAAVGFDVLAAVRSEKDMEKFRGNLDKTLKGSVTPILLDVANEVTNNALL